MVQQLTVTVPKYGFFRIFHFFIGAILDHQFKQYNKYNCLFSGIFCFLFFFFLILYIQAKQNNIFYYLSKQYCLSKFFSGYPWSWFWNWKLSIFFLFTTLKTSKFFSQNRFCNFLQGGNGFINGHIFFVGNDKVCMVADHWGKNRFCVSERYISANVRFSCFVFNTEHNIALS